VVRAAPGHGPEERAQLLHALLRRATPAKKNSADRLFDATIDQAWRRQKFTTLLGDAGYESERFHRRCREDLGVRSIIPTTQRGRPRKDGRPRPVRGHYRQLMRRRFPKKTYGQRWQIETVLGMIKRNLGATLTARSYHRQNREIALRLLTHNLMILLCLNILRAFQQSRTVTYF